MKDELAELIKSKKITNLRDLALHFSYLHADFVELKDKISEDDKANTGRFEKIIEQIQNIKDPLAKLISDVDIIKKIVYGAVGLVLVAFFAAVIILAIPSWRPV